MSSRHRSTLAGPILRVRTGCLTCRGRKKKCDETKPCCRGCQRNEFDCQWPAPATRRRDPARDEAAPLPSAARQRAGTAAAASRPSKSPEANTAVAPTPQAYDETPPMSRSQPTSYAANGSQEDDILGPLSAHESPVDFAAALDPLCFPTASDECHDNELLDDNLVAPLSALPSPGVQVPRQLSFLPGITDSSSMDLLSHYLGVMTVSMANGSTPDNPFCVQLIPLAFGSNFVLQLLLTQSAVHRASKCLSSGDRVANQYYGRSIRLFQRSLSSFIGGQTLEQKLTMGIGALILCFIETAKGDINGAIFDHLMAAQPLLLPSLTLRSRIPKGLQDFLTEYYVYTATLSMISIDARVNDQLFLSSDLVPLATDLVAASYVGSLCGCWLDLLLLIPSIFELDRRLLSHTEDPSWRPSANDFFTWTPNLAVSSEIIVLAGYVYQKAVLLYLYTTLYPLSQDDGDRHRDDDDLSVTMTQAALSEALASLAQLPPNVQVNTSLCWPIAVVGSCVVDEGQRSFLRERLEHTFSAIGLGNMRQTSVLLQHIWDDCDKKGGGIVDSGPWSKCRVMNDRQLWISFA
ncbi:fungal-specific transcription factor domain-containing protein [Colletotrichum phormii]|uniref:Fungal-specific transcription factor domain-containing protein n=1 Tax=Colletotrichum phormii TaxID=359342 RepID=A0AAI9ZHX2_9PEZI|nr:fungal-specific transcription factor domain-containing protein [Colletotrichum phormii]KAK1624904.1 fungal-specific transcription factor domain-containing protein [Colletotrichum phormii]